MNLQKESTHSQLYTLGPKCEQWLAAHQNESFEKIYKNKNELHSFLLSAVLNSPTLDKETISDLVDELFAMDLPELALKMIDCHWDHIQWPKDFRTLLVEGSSSMLAQDFERAKIAFTQAQELAPHEPAPYVNMYQILDYDRQNELAAEWLEEGLNSCKNHIPLWELFAYSLSQETEKNRFVKIKEKAKKLNSWTGYSLSSELDPDKNISTKVSCLKPFYDGGERDQEFLIEYTGALGAAGQFEDIPALIWELQRKSNQELVWKLHLHLLQTYLALDKKELFFKEAGSFLSRKEVPTGILDELRSIIAEEETTPTLH